jgi:hypothetical protein
MTIRDRVRQWLGLDELATNLSLTALRDSEERHYRDLAKTTTSSGEWAAQNGLAIQAQLADITAKLDKLAAIIEPQAPKFIRAVPRVLSFEAAQFEDLAASIEQEKTNGVHR